MKKLYVSFPFKQRGVAIVLAMSVVALAALAATAMAVAQSTWSRHLMLNNDHTQARFMTDAGMDWARAVLSDDSRVSNVDYSGEPWSMNVPPIPVEHGSLSGNIKDEQGKFNLNNLAKNGKINLAQLASFRRLLTTLALPPELADALADWIDSDNDIQIPGGAEDAYYASLTSPYLTANQPLITTAELASVRGFNDKVRIRLRPFVTALPHFTAVNVNTATPEVIAALVYGLKLDDARQIIQQRGRSYFRTPAEFFNLIPNKLIVANDNIAVNSHYFMVNVEANINNTQAHATALLARENSNWPTIIWSRYQ